MSYVPAAGISGYGAGMADAVQEAAYVSYPSAAAASGVDGVAAQYDYTQYQACVSCSHLRFHCMTCRPVPGYLVPGVQSAAVNDGAGAGILPVSVIISDDRHPIHQ